MTSRIHSNITTGILLACLVKPFECWVIFQKIYLKCYLLFKILKFCLFFKWIEKTEWQTGWISGLLPITAVGRDQTCLLKYKSIPRKLWAKPQTFIKEMDIFVFV